jgi:hypothetical protein
MRMDALKWLEATANVAAVITAIVATVAYCRFLYDRRRKRSRLEAYLKTDKHQHGRTLLELATTLGMTEAEIMDAAFRSKHVRRTATTALLGAPSEMLLDYESKPSN